MIAIGSPGRLALVLTQWTPRILWWRASSSKAMGLEVSLMATVEAIVDWVVQVENGGLLNVLFEDISSTSKEPQFTLSQNIHTSILNFLQNMLAYKPLALPVLQAMPGSLGGGVAGVDEANANPNREPEIFWITMGLLGAILILIIVLQIINCCCCCCGHKARHLNRVQVAAVDKDLKHKNLVCRVTYITLLAIAFLFVAASVILLAIYFSSANLVVAHLEIHEQTSSTPNFISLPDGLQAAVKHLSTFIKQGIESGQQLTEWSFNSFATQTDGEISANLRRVTTKLQDHLQLPDVTEKGQSNLGGIKNCSVNSKSAGFLMDKLKPSISALNDQIAHTQELYKVEFNKITNCDQKCESLKTRVDKLRSPIDPNKLDSGLVNELASKLDGIHEDFEALQTKLQTTIDSIQGSADEIMLSLKKELQLQEILGTVDEFWPQAETQSQKLLEEVDKATTTLTTRIPQGAKFVRIVLYSIGGFLVFMVLIAVLIFARLLYRGITSQLYGDPDDIPAGSNLNAWDRLACGKCSACCCSVFFVFILLIFAIVVGVLLFVLTTISGEGCIYLAQESAVAKTDFVVNSLVAEQWDSIMSGVATGEENFLNTSPPQNMLTALIRTCDYVDTQQVVGLLSAMNYQNLVDVHKLVTSPKVQDGINNGKVIAVKAIKDLEISTKLPPEADFEAIRKKLDEALKNIDLDELLTATKPEVMDIAPLNKLHNDLEDYGGSAQSPGDAGFTKPNEELKKVISSMSELALSVKDLHLAIEVVNEEKNNLLSPFGELIEALKTTVNLAGNEEGVAAEVTSQYDVLIKTVMGFMERKGNLLFAQVTQELLPCLEAHKAYMSMTGATCGNVNLLLGFVYVLALNVFFLVFLYFALFNLAFFQGILLRMAGEEEEEEEEEENSSSDDDYSDDESEESQESSSTSSVTSTSDTITSTVDDDSVVAFA
ncbi:unnamed protein product [Hydatigera taeniaeformis]|uniref:Protein tweety homolog n=1 Tax=Hydatigena taeniaeformis TaxID=6205 RepID=A0A0R3WMJ9_HYDTA|nr:unnamed protein product [Hydatigera taeniaeformis]